MAWASQYGEIVRYLDRLCQGFQGSISTTSLATNRYINGSPVQLLFKSRISHNFLNDPNMGNQTIVSDHTYKVHLADGRVQ